MASSRSPLDQLIGAKRDTPEAVKVKRLKAIEAFLTMLQKELGFASLKEMISHESFILFYLKQLDKTFQNEETPLEEKSQNVERIHTRLKELAHVEDGPPKSALELLEIITRPSPEAS